MWNRIAEAVAHATGESFAVEEARPCGGGSINESFVLRGNGKKFFVKLNDRRHGDMFDAEALGLGELAAAGALRVPRPLCTGIDGERAFLVLEWLPLVGSGDWERLGAQLAALHRRTSAHGFGWQRDNTIGSTPQPNPWTSNWTEFFGRHRLGHQLALARRRGVDGALSERLLAALPALLAGHDPAPSLLHGDLWGGNAAFTGDGEPVIFDPAVYYGDREADLAMTELFGGFAAGFYAAYRRAWPLAPGYEQRREFYNLYHILNHATLFGGSYVGQANRTMLTLLQQLS